MRLSVTSLNSATLALCAPILCWAPMPITAVTSRCGKWITVSSCISAAMCSTVTILRIMVTVHILLLLGWDKATIVLKLLMKFYKLESGEIRINNINIEDYKTDSYREKIGYVPQESLLFSGTIEENIGWGSVNPSREQIVVAAANAQALNFIDSLPDKFRTIVGEQGATLSGGERQRIALARVLMRNPHFLILDEATASLDSISEHEIMETIYKKIKKRTVIMVAHRLSTIRQCDLIYVFEKGKLAYEKMGSGDKCFLVEGDGSHRFYADDSWPVLHKMIGR